MKTKKIFDQNILKKKISSKNIFIVKKFFK